MTINTLGSAFVARQRTAASEPRSPAATRCPSTASKRRVLLVFLTRYEYAAPLLQGVVQYGRTHGEPWTVIRDEFARAETDTPWLLSQRWDGVISRHTTPELVQACGEHGIPLIDLNDSPQFAGVPKIRPDNTAIGHLGGEYLLDLGFNHFAFCGYGDQGWSRERRAGFVEAVRLRNHDCAVHEVPHPPQPVPFGSATQDESLRAWLLGLPKPVGIMACHDVRAVDLLDAAQAAGLLVPEEIAVLGANNDALHCELATPPLSSIATNPHQIGFRAAELLATLMDGKPVAPEVELIAPLRVVSRRSTDVLAIPDQHVAAALRYIWRHACDPMNVDQVLPLARVSRSQLEKKFRQYIGRSPQAEIRRVQVMRIRQLLAETDFPLKKIAELAGFDYPEYMCVAFRRMTGETPGTYRSKMKHSRTDNPDPA